MRIEKKVKRYDFSNANFVRVIWITYVLGASENEVRKLRSLVH